MKKFLLFGFIIVLISVIPLTVYYLQKTQETRSRAKKATTLSLCTSGTSCASRTSTTIGQTFDLDVVIDPGTNQVVITTLSISYDPSKIATSSSGTPSTPCGDSLCPTSTLPFVMSGPTYTNSNATITLSIGADATKTIQSPTKIATIRFKALAETGATETLVTFSDKTSASTAPEGPGSEPEINVLSTTEAARVTIGAGPTPTSPPTTPTINKPPVCTALNVDRSPSGFTPFSITFTANGNDPDGTINKATFDFGDGPVQDVAQSGGVGSNSVSVQVAHAYQNPGTYKATVTLTDNSNAVSSSSVNCSQTITVSQAQSVGGSSSSTGSAVVTIPPPPQVVSSPVPTSRPTPITTIADTGPGDTIIGIGALGAVLSVIGALIFFAL